MLLQQQVCGGLARHDPAEHDRLDIGKLRQSALIDGLLLIEIGKHHCERVKPDSRSFFSKRLHNTRANFCKRKPIVGGPTVGMPIPTNTRTYVGHAFCQSRQDWRGPTTSTPGVTSHSRQRCTLERRWPYLDNRFETQSDTLSLLLISGLTNPSIIKVGETWIPFWRAYLQCLLISRSRSGIAKAPASRTPL